MANVSTNSRYDYLFKVLLCGDSGVGKTSMLYRQVSDKMNDAYTATIGVDFKLTTLEMKGHKIKLQIWDTAGQERFKALTAQYYRRAQGILLVYDITNEQSFENTTNWLRMIQENSTSDLKLMLIGNKIDNEQKRKVTTHQGQQLAKDYGLNFIETSALSSENISEAFTTLTESILIHMQGKYKEMVRSQVSLNKLGLNDSSTKPKQTSLCAC
ncbi:ras-related protein Rab-13-like [Dysidea avara]|uniref:ras-related protein Rab-13-like n=1 Tax=Dysidea avara TaxID=196820 RepID=UPI003333B282